MKSKPRYKYCVKVERASSHRIIKYSRNEPEVLYTPLKCLLKNIPDDDVAPGLKSSNRLFANNGYLYELHLNVLGDFYYNGCQTNDCDERSRSLFGVFFSFFQEVICCGPSRRSYIPKPKYPPAVVIPCRCRASRSIPKLENIFCHICFPDNRKRLALLSEIMTLLSQTTALFRV